MEHRDLIVLGESKEKDFYAFGGDGHAMVTYNVTAAKDDDVITVYRSKEPLAGIIKVIETDGRLHFMKKSSFEWIEYKV